MPNRKRAILQIAKKRSSLSAISAKSFQAKTLKRRKTGAASPSLFSYWPPARVDCPRLSSSRAWIVDVEQRASSGKSADNDLRIGSPYPLAISGSVFVLDVG